jgi:hypothetical protein
MSHRTYYYIAYSIKLPIPTFDEVLKICKKVDGLSVEGNPTVSLTFKEGLTKEEMDALDRFFKERGFTHKLNRVSEIHEYEEELE